MTLSAEGGRRPRPGLGRRLAAISDGAIIRAAFLVLLAGTICVLYVDYGELTLADGVAGVRPGLPVLPAFDPDAPGNGPGPQVTTDMAVLEAPLSVDLAADGVLEVRGTIDVGAAERFAAEVERRGSYVQTVSLDSPGGSVADALAMGALIRQKGFATSVGAGALCASSCPLVLAGGEARKATQQSAIGVHQIYANADPAQAGFLPKSVESAMADAQATTATIGRYLDEMGVDSRLWLYALETPPGNLYYFSPEELVELKLVTALD